jgi:hypothetical protein
MICSTLRGNGLGEMIRENIRSGRKANFYITDNSFIDHYARQVEPSGIAIYHVLERYANYETRATWVGTAKIAEVLGLSQRSVQRHLKILEDLKLIKILRTATLTTYVVLPVPPRPKCGTAPLFDSVPDQELGLKGDTRDASATCVTDEVTSVSSSATFLSPTSDMCDGLYKEEQELFNKTIEQENKNPTQKAHELVLTMFGMPATTSNLSRVKAAIEAEAVYTGRSIQEAAQAITNSAIRDRENGIPIDKFYFEDAKWRHGGRSSVRVNKAEQRKLDNLEINARVKQRLRERFGDA